MKTKLLLITLLTSFCVSAQYSFEEFKINANGSSEPHSFVEFNGALYFSAKGETFGRELWKTDGTESGTILIKDINTNGDSDPRRLTVVNNQLFFTAKTDTSGRELWKSDGTQAGTVLVKDINSGFGDGVAYNRGVFKTLNNKLIFTGQQQGASNTYLFESDGTSAGTNPISTDVNVIANVYTERSILNYNNVIFFEGKNKSGASQGRELWKTDGTSAGTVLVKDINPGSSSSFPSEMIIYNNAVYFKAEKSGQGSELWKTDGTEVGTSLVKDIRPGGASSISNYAKFKVFKNKLYFSANDGTHGREIWVSDGTESRTELFLDINSTGNQNSIIENDGTQQLFYVYNDKMYFKATDSYNASNIENNIEPWETDGTVAGTKQIADLNPNGNSMDVYNYFYNYNNRLLFTGRDFSNTTLGNLWSYDFSNTPEKIMPGNTTSTDVGTDFYRPIVFNQSLYVSANFNINNTNNGAQLWKITSNPLSVNEVFGNSNQSLIYPNPANITVTISLKNTDDLIDKIAFFNLLGKRVFSQDVLMKESKVVNASHLKTGVYFVKVKGKKQTYTNKLIINN